MHKNTNRLLALVAGLFILPLAHAQTEAPAEQPAAAPVEATAEAPAAAAAEAVDPAAEEEENYVADIDGESERDARKGLGVGLRVSTLGAGVELIYSLSKHFNIRGQGNFVSLDESVEEDGVKYDGKLDFETLGLLVDYHPFGGSFRISAGAFQNGNEIGLQATCPPPNGCQIGNTNVQSTPGPDPARVTGKIDFNSTAPYAGIGFGNAMKGWPVHFAFDIGVLFQGSPKADLDARGQATTTGGVVFAGDIATSPQIQAEVTQEEQNLQKEIDEFKMYPVVSLTIGYRFSF